MFSIFSGVRVSRKKRKKKENNVLYSFSGVRVSRKKEKKKRKTNINTKSLPNA